MALLAQAPWTDMERELSRHKAHMRQLSLTNSNALQNFSYFQSMAHNKKVVVLLDYDGTLTPIVNDPNKALLPDRTKSILVELAHHCVVGIVSGWAADHLPKLASVRDTLIEELSPIEGAAVEDNTFSVSVHYRNCAPESVQQVFDVVQGVKASYPSIKFGTGKKVFELRPDITWDKGKAMEWLLQALGLNDRDDVFTLYIGDDVTDEDAFQVFCDQDRGVRHGVGIVVTEESKFTGAKFSLHNPDEVATFLSLLIATQREAGATKGEVSFDSDRVSGGMVDARSDEGSSSGEEEGGPKQEQQQQPQV